MNANRKFAIVVDRDSFIAFTQGILLSRDRNGYVVVGDDPNNQAAEDFLRAGKEVLLTVHHKPYSILRYDKDNEQYVETVEEEEEVRA